MPKVIQNFVDSDIDNTRRWISFMKSRREEIKSEAKIAVSVGIIAIDRLLAGFTLIHIAVRNFSLHHYFCM